MFLTLLLKILKYVRDETSKDSSLVTFAAKKYSEPWQLQKIFSRLEVSLESYCGLSLDHFHHELANAFHSASKEFEHGTFF